MKIQLKTQDVAVIGICAALYAVVGRLTAGFTFLGVGFLPAVVIPAVFAVLYGPWVGGISGAIGIFIRDMFVHGNAALSLAAGVPPNFILFFLIGYIAARDIDNKKITVALVLSAAVIVVGLIVPTLIYPAEFTALTGLTTTEILLVFGLTVVLSFVIFVWWLFVGNNGEALRLQLSSGKQQERHYFPLQYGQSVLFSFPTSNHLSELPLFFHFSFGPSPLKSRLSFLLGHQ